MPKLNCSEGFVRFIDKNSGMAAETSTFDYIIVGGGLCGCILASRLKQDDPSLKILLIEADPDSAVNSLTTVQCLRIPKMEIVCSYSTVPQKHLNNHSYRVRAGKILSGGTALNATMWARGRKSRLLSLGLSCGRPEMEL